MTPEDFLFFWVSNWTFIFVYGLKQLIHSNQQATTGHVMKNILFITKLFFSYI